MAQDVRVAKRYAGALFGAARQAGTIDAVEADLAAIVGALQNNDTFRKFLLSPDVARGDKSALVEKVFSDRVTALSMQALRLMLAKNRETELPAVLEQFQALRRAHENVVLTRVESAEPLDDAQRQALLAKLEQTLGKKIQAHYEVDPHLLGGVRVTYGHEVLDGTLRGALGALRERLRTDLLKQTL